MAWRQKQWKYKNTTPKAPKKEEWISGISASRLMMACGNYIHASSKYMAFNIDGHGGGGLGILPLETTGSIGSNLPYIHAHSQFVSDFSFSPHSDTLLASLSFDTTVKLWKLSDTPGGTLPQEPHALIAELPKRGDALQWNPLVSNIITVVCGNLMRIYDVNTMDKIYDYDCHEDVIHGISWSLDGAHITTVCKDKFVRIFDPRTNSSSAVQAAEGHQGVKDSRIVYVNDGKIITTGYDSNRAREVKVYDGRNLSDALNTVEIDNSPGTLIPLFDEDIGMVYFCGKGDNNVRFMEFSNKQPYLTEAACDMMEQLKGACLIPKRSVDVMKGEVNRLLVLTKDAVIPVPYIIPRRSYAEYHADVFPDTYSGEPGATAQEWRDGVNPQKKLVSLDPALNQAATGTVTLDRVQLEQQEIPDPTPAAAPPPVRVKTVQNGSGSGRSSPASQKVEHNVKPSERKAAAAPVSAAGDRPASVTVKKMESKHTQTYKPLKWSHLSACRTKPVTVRTSKFRHLKGASAHRSERIDNLRNLNISVPGECDAFIVNEKRCAVILQGSAGFVSVLEFSSPGKLEDTPLPTLTHGCGVTDFQFDPFNDRRLVTGTESGCICIWLIPEDGLTETCDTPKEKIAAHNDKIYSIRFHPSASNVLASSAQDMLVKIWNLETAQCQITLKGHTSTIFSVSWSISGAFLTTLCKDAMIRVYAPRSSDTPIQYGSAPPGSRGGRAVWVLDDQYIAVSGFDRQSNRLLQLFDPIDLSVPVATTDLDCSPSILIPFYDEDSRTIIMTSRGDTIVQSFEICTEDPYFFPLASYHANGQHQALAFLPKSCVNVREIEFAKAYRLTQNYIEPVSFTVPRVRSEFFQDDLFPETRVSWESSLSAHQWFSGEDKNQKRISLKPADMVSLSDAPPEPVKQRKYDKFDPSAYKTDAEKRDELVSAVTSNLDMRNDPLPQDLCEGVASDEWTD